MFTFVIQKRANVRVETSFCRLSRDIVQNVGQRNVNVRIIVHDDVCLFDRSDTTTWIWTWSVMEEEEEVQL